MSQRLSDAALDEHAVDIEEWDDQQYPGPWKTCREVLQDLRSARTELATYRTAAASATVEGVMSMVKATGMKRGYSYNDLRTAVTALAVESEAKDRAIVYLADAESGYRASMQCSFAAGDEEYPHAVIEAARARLAKEEATDGNR